MGTAGEMKMSALSEYLVARQGSIKSALEYNADGRPGVAEIRQLQEQLRNSISAHKIITNANINSSNSSYHSGNPMKNNREIRQYAVDQFLRELNLYKKDIVDGSPRQLFGVSIFEDDIRLQYLVDIKKLGRGWFYRQIEDVSWDNNRYSKSWHRQYGGVKSVGDRRVAFKRMTKRGVESKTVNVSGWRGDWLAKSVVEAGLAPKCKEMPSLKIRLNKAYGAKLIEVKRGYKIFQRTLLDSPVDWVIQSPLGMIYHDYDRKNLVKGLHNKIRQQSRKLQGLINWGMCKKLGFCSEGILEFCDLFGFDADSSYTPREIETEVRKHPELAVPFLSDLKILADSLDYHYSI